MRNLQILAESSQRLSDLTKATEPGVAWRDIAGFRNVLVHGYLAVNWTPYGGWWSRISPPCPQRLSGCAASCRPEGIHEFRQPETAWMSNGCIRSGHD